MNDTSAENLGKPSEAWGRPRKTTGADRKPADTWLLAGLYAFTIVALVGFATFGLDPARLAGRPAWLGQVYAVSFTVFAQGQVALAALVLLVLLTSRAKLQWAGAFALVYALSLTAELGGTTWGVPFGGYHYTDGLGPAWLGRVPILIPVSWFCMAVPSWALAGAVSRGRGLVARIVAGSLILLAWDLSLDPAMSFVTRYWVWAEVGPYYGMPLGNLLGWYLTGLVLMGALAVMRADRWLDRLPLHVLAAYYGANLLLPLGMNAAAGLTWAVVAGLVPIVSILGVVAVRSQSRRAYRLWPGEAI